MPEELKPFHLSILNEIRCVESPDHLRILARIIRGTEIRRGHDTIVRAWRERMEFLHIDLDFGVPNAVLSQKPPPGSMESTSAMSDEEITQYIEDRPDLKAMLEANRNSGRFDEMLRKRFRNLTLISDYKPEDDEDDDLTH